MSGLMIAAPSSGSGKTTVTLGLMRALKRRGIAVAPGKAGPDYIDPAFHTAASGTPCLNYDPWAMRRELLVGNAAQVTADGRTLIVEAMMGLYDGAADGS
ncbi:MAG TPA: cobyrinic acid a,c-diamide synthase, partial [Sinorhizobium sp.]|nr:cobyrinic acid a,c-diamide synthase [Sinorhizobium sp.]